MSEGNVIDWTEEAIRESAAPRDARFQDLTVLAQHNWVPYRDGEPGPHCLTCGVPFPCAAVLGVARRYGWTGGDQ